MLDIEVYWDDMFRSWVLLVLDDEGNQVWEAQYYPSRRAMREQWLL